jgi:hypothetical protein
MRLKDLLIRFASGPPEDGTHLLGMRDKTG